MTTATSDIQRKHPRGFYINFYAQLFMMYSFTMCNSLLILYVSNKLGFPDKAAYALAGANSALLFSSQFLGGFLGGHYLGYKPGFYLGCIISCIGYLLLASQQQALLYISLAMITMGFGLIVPCVYALLGNLYVDGDIRRESGFTYNYVGLNIGAFASALSSGYLARYCGYNVAFLLAALFLIAGFLAFFLSRQYYSRLCGQRPPYRT